MNIHCRAGELCETQKDPCRKLDCKNNGTCIVMENIAFCDCPMGFGGNLRSQYIYIYIYIYM